MTENKTQVSFEDVLAVVFEGMRLGILDCIGIDYKRGHVDFYYGGLNSDNYITQIWVESDYIKGDYHRRMFTELKRKVKKAQKEQTNGNRQKYEGE